MQNSNNTTSNTNDNASFSEYIDDIRASSISELIEHSKALEKALRAPDSEIDQLKRELIVALIDEIRAELRMREAIAAVRGGL